MRKLLFAALPILAATASPAFAACNGVTFDVAFASDYDCTDLGSPGSPVGGPLGGITFLDDDTLLIGGFANGSAGSIYSIDVVRGVDNHITGFASAATFFAAAPNIDGGLTFGPNGVMFVTTFSNNQLLQYLPGSTTPDKVIDLSSIGVAASTGTLLFVPDGFGGEGQLKIASYSTNFWYTATLTPDGNGLFDVSVEFETQVTGGPEGIVYVAAGNDGFAVDSVLIAEWAAGRVGAYAIDGNGDPLLGTRVDFITGLSGAEGAVVDPLTGDFLFSTFGGGDRVLVISGFDAPISVVPEASTWAMMIGGFGLVGGALRRRRTGQAALA